MQHGCGTTADDDARLERRNKVWKLRVSGSTIREIAAELGCGIATVHSDLSIVRDELTDRNQIRSEIERAVGEARLDKAARVLLATLDQTMIDKNGEVDGSQVATVANAIARIEERRSKLLGLDKPFETVIHQTEASPEMARRLMAEQFGRTAKKTDNESA